MPRSLRLERRALRLCQRLPRRRLDRRDDRRRRASPAPAGGIREDRGQPTRAARRLVCPQDRRADERNRLPGSAAADGDRSSARHAGPPGRALRDRGTGADGRFARAGNARVAHGGARSARPRCAAKTAHARSRHGRRLRASHVDRLRRGTRRGARLRRPARRLQAGRSPDTLPRRLDGVRVSRIDLGGGAGGRSGAAAGAGAARRGWPLADARLDRFPRRDAARDDV